MNRKKLRKTSLFKLSLISTLILFSCSNQTSDSTISTPSESISDNVEKDPYTLLIYLCGSDLESRSGEASKNIQEMIEASKRNPDVNIVLQTGGAKRWHRDGISPYSTDRYLIKNGTMTMVERNVLKENFGDPETLTKFVRFGTENYPSLKTSLILWDHGQGALKGVCFDENFNYDSLSLAELKKALNDSELDFKFDFIGFDACLMASFETAKTVETFADNMIASTEKEPNGGWDYQSVVSHLGKEDFYQETLLSFAKKSQNKAYYTLSHIDLSKLNVISSRFDTLLDKMRRSTPRDIIGYVNAAPTYGTNGNDLYDFGGLFSSYGIDSDFSSVIETVSGDLHAAGSGMSIYFPVLTSQYLSLYQDNHSYQPYNEFLTSFYQQMNEEKISFISYGENRDDRLSFILDEQSLDYIGSIEYSLYQSLDNEAWMALGTDNDYEYDGTYITIDFQGHWIQFADHWLYCTIVDELDDYTTYRSPILIDGEEAELFFGYEFSTATAEVLGVVYTDAQGSKDTGRQYDLQEGDSIQLIQKTMDDNGYQSVYTDPFVYHKEQTKIEVKTLPDGYYQYTAYVTDVYGKRYTAGTAVVQVSEGVATIVTVTTDEVIYPE